MISSGSARIMRGSTKSSKGSNICFGAPPRDVGVRVTEVTDAELYVYRTRPGFGLPGFHFVYEIKENVVELFGIGLADRGSLT